VKLYTFWRSQAAFRVRIALNLKGLTREDIVINLDRGDQFKPEYRAQNPQAVVPTLYDGNAKLFSLWPSSNISKRNIPIRRSCRRTCRARVGARLRPNQRRGFASADRTAHPQLSRQRTEGRRTRPHRVDPALARQRIARDGGVASGEESDRQFCDGDNPTIADISLVTQVTPVQLFNTDVEPFKRVMRIYDACMAIPAFADAHPRKQPDFEGH
jgi:glutathione S-transferase